MSESGPPSESGSRGEWALDVERGAGGSIPVRIWRVRGERDADLALPARATPGSAGYDLRAAVDADLKVEPGAYVRVPTGFAIALPQGFEAQVRPRSGLAFSHGVTLLNAPGTVDADYRGELMVLLVNHGREIFTVQRGERIAQLVLARVETLSLQEVDGPDALGDTSRGSGGFGHTGR